MTTLLQPGRISPIRKVPSHIQRPEYVGKKAPKTGEADVKTPEIIERMRVAGKLAAQALEEVGRHVAPGVTTDELDRIGHEFLCDRGAYPSTLGYRGYPKSLCTSINEVICHGIPDDTVLRDGDIVNIDITAFIGGVHGDTDATFLGRRRGRGVAPPGRAHPRGHATAASRPSPPAASSTWSVA